MGYKGRKYLKLHTHLCGLDAREWMATFADIEAIIGAKLPPSARYYQAWWANDSSHSQGAAWAAAGWKTAEVDMDAETAVFRRKDSPDFRRRTIDAILPPRSFGPWPEGLSLRREDLYKERI